MNYFLIRKKFMEGYRVKLQNVERPTNRSYYVNFPVAVTEALGIEKGEKFEWIIEDKNTLIFKRVIPVLQEKKVKLTPMRREVGIEQ